MVGCYLFSYCLFLSTPSNPGYRTVLAKTGLWSVSEYALIHLWIHNLIVTCPCSDQTCGRMKHESEHRPQDVHRSSTVDYCVHHHQWCHPGESTSCSTPKTFAAIYQIIINLERVLNLRHCPSFILNALDVSAIAAVCHRHSLSICQGGFLKEMSVFGDGLDREKNLLVLINYLAWQAILSKNHCCFCTMHSIGGSLVGLV